MKSKLITIYQCDFCNKYGKHSGHIKKHEKYCSHNPATWHKCSECVNLIVEHENIYSDYYERDITVNNFICNKLNKNMYQLKAEKMGLIKRYPESFEGKELMPFECEHFKFDNNDDFDFEI